VQAGISKVTGGQLQAGGIFGTGPDRTERANTSIMIFCGEARSPQLVFVGKGMKFDQHPCRPS
jgi:hypothetical protein